MQPRASTLAHEPTVSRPRAKDPPGGPGRPLPAALIDRFSDALGRISAWAYFVVGLMLGYEVLARYFFNAPTIWAAELSQLIFVFATLLAAPALLRGNGHIRVTALTALLGPPGRRAARLISLAFIFGLAILLAWHGLDAPINSYERGRTSGTMLNLPAWWAQSAVPLAFTLLALQAALEFVRTALGAPLPPESITEE
jgi:C4-dicarboxylate transporter, DctQ subunit